MFDKAQNQDIYNRIMSAGTKSGHLIADEISLKKMEYKDTDDALRSLCTQRGCKADIETPGDTTPIKLLKTERANIDADINKLCSTQYVRLSSVFRALNIQEEEE